MSDGRGVREPRGGRKVLRAGLCALVAGLLVVPSPGAARTGVQHEIECLALNIYFEARGEPDAGRRAVGHVVMNRVSDKQ